MATVSTRPAFAPGLMLHALARNWWLIMLKGICAILFGIAAFLWPALSLVTLVLFYGLFALADGLIALAAALTGNSPAPRWWLAVVGLIGVGAGIVTLLWPGITAIVLQVFIACWAIATGFMQIVGAIQMRREIDDEWLLILGGALSMVFGFILLTRPGVGALALILVIASYAIMYGLVMVWFAWRLRGHRHDVPAGPAPAGVRG